MAAFQMRHRSSFSRVSIEVEIESQQHQYFPSSLSSPSASPPLDSSVSWRQRMEDLLWIASAIFIIYYGDFRSNLFSILRNDPRVHRGALCGGMGCLAIDMGILCYIVVRLKLMNRKEDKVEITAAAAIPSATIIALAAFVLFCFALWPIWSFLTLPMMFTLLMAFVVVTPYIEPYMNVKIDLESMRCLLPVQS